MSNDFERQREKWLSLKRTGVSPRVRKGIIQGFKGHKLGLGREREREGKKEGDQLG